MRRRDAKRVLVLLALAGAAAGCGDPALWARWQAQRGLFRAQSQERRAIARGDRTADRERVERKFRALLEQFPPERWAPATPDTSIATEVAVAGSRAGLALAASEARGGRLDAAAAELARLEARIEHLPGMLLVARLERYGVLEQLGRFDDAFAELAAVAATDPLGDPARREPPPEVLESPLRLAAELRSRGRSDDAAAALADADARFGAALERARPEARQALALALASVRAERGDAAGALAPLRRQLLAASPGIVADWAEVMGAHALQAGAPESALVYSRWAYLTNDTRRVAGPAMMVAAQAWEKLGRADSALVAYELLLRHWPDPGALGPVARFRRARLLESLGQWDLAHGEYLALVAKFPTHELALTSGVRIVAHHLEANEPELARLAGETSMAHLDQLLVTNRDPDVQRQARAARAALLLDLGRLPEAEAALLDQWRRYPADSAAQEAGMRAATLARHRPGGGPRADSILAALRRNAFSATVRREAGAGADASPAVPRP